MSDINPNNYDQARSVVVGRAGGPYEVRSFGNGGSQAQLSIAVSKGYKKDGEWVDTGTDWYTLTAAPAYAEDNWPEIEKGDKVRVDDAKLEARVFKKNDGEPGLELKLTYGTLVVIERKADRASGNSAPAAEADQGTTPF